MQFRNSMSSWACAVGAALLVAACGGGSSSPEPAPPVAPAADRIEPFDPGLAGAAKSAAAAPAAGRAPQATPVRLGPLAAAALQTKTAPASGPGVRQQIGVARSVAATATPAGLMAQLQWQSTERGTQRAAIRFEAEGAYGVRLGVRVHALPAGATLRFYAQAGDAEYVVSGEEVLRTIARNLQAGDADNVARTYWSPDFGGPETTLELEVPTQADRARVDIAVPQLSHFFVSPERAAEASLTKVGEAASCNIDVSCKPEFSSESRSVARMLYVEGDGRSYLCTGTLLNDALSSGTPYFLSASHCISTQTVASSLVTDWFYRSSACKSGVRNPGTQHLNGGATLLYANAATDTVFLRLNDAPPAGAVFAGSYFGTVAAGASMAGLHHPWGDLQKFSQGAVVQFSTCSVETESCQDSTPQDGRFFNVDWSAGTTEKGSSGSALFFPIGSRHYVVGQLFGGTASCLDPTGVDRYGRFDLAFQSALQKWLKPAP